MAKTISIGAAWSEAAAFLRSETRLVVPVVLALMVLPVTISQLAQPVNALAPSQAPSWWVVLGFVAVFIGVIGQMAVSRLAMGSERSLGGVIGLAARRFPVAFAAFLMAFLAMFAIVLPVVLILVAVGGSAGLPLMSALLPLLIVLAVTPRIILVPTLAMRGHAGPWRLLKDSWAASRGNYWRLLGFMLLMLIGSVVLALAVGAVFGSVAVLTLGPPEPWTLSRLMVALCGGLVQGVVMAVYSAMLGRMVAQVDAAGSISGT